MIFATYSAIVERGDTVVYPVPSWNNNHYCHLVGARGVPLETAPEHGFLPTAASLKPVLKTARLIALNTPLNPAGTVLSPEEVVRISEAVVDENRRRWLISLGLYPACLATAGQVHGARVVEVSGPGHAADCDALVTTTANPESAFAISRAAA